MNYCEGKLLRIKGKGKVLIITDLHGNIDDTKRYEKIWKEYLERGDEVVIVKIPSLVKLTSYSEKHLIGP